jgi:hypothetical protein
MILALFDQLGNRKYLIARERLAFVYAASKKGDPTSTLCLTMAFTGARIETTAIYASAIGDEDRNLARKAWSSLELAIPDVIGVEQPRD